MASRARLKKVLKKDRRPILNGRVGQNRKKKPPIPVRLSATETLEPKLEFSNWGKVWRLHIRPGWGKDSTPERRKEDETDARLPEKEKT